MHVGGGGLVVMVWTVVRITLALKDVQVFDGKTQAWTLWTITEVVHGDVIFVMGGAGMAIELWQVNTW